MQIIGEPIEAVEVKVLTSQTHTYKLGRQPRSQGSLLSVHTELACVAGAKRGGGEGREKGKREGSACSKSLCFCITPTNFLVIRLRLLSIKCRYTRHCRKTLHSWTKEIRLVIIQKSLWRKLEPLFSGNKKSFTLQKRSKKLRLHQRANPADQKTITTVNRYVCHDLSVRLKLHLLSISAEPSRP